MFMAILFHFLSVLFVNAVQLQILSYGYYSYKDFVLEFPDLVAYIALFDAKKDGIGA